MCVAVLLALMVMASTQIRIRLMRLISVEQQVTLDLVESPSLSAIHIPLISLNI